MLTLRELERAARILGRELAGHRVQRVVQPDAYTVVLEVYGGAGPGEGRRRFLLLSAHPESARVSCPAEAPRGAPGPPRFAQWGRAHLRGARVEGVRIEGGDRQLALRLRTHEGPLELLLAIFGRRSNVVVLDGEGRIACALRPLAETRPELGTGDLWRAPASTPPRAGEDRFETVPDDAFLEAVEERYAGSAREGAFEELARRLEQALRKERKTVERKLAKLEAELATARADAGLERAGELLKGAMDRVRRGDTDVVVRDHETGEDVTIPLDPAKSPAENLERLFKRYRKALRALAKGGAQEEAVRASRDELDRLAAELAAVVAREPGAERLAALQALGARPRLARLAAKYAAAPAPERSREGERVRRLGGREVPGRLAPRRYRSESGLEIWVGRSDEANDFLTTRLARGSDLFFHLDGAPGSHVILRTEGRDDPPPEAVLDACELAVHFSKQKKATRADVHVVPIKNVRKPKGAKPGLVYVHGGRQVHLRRSPARLARVLATRIDD